MRDPKRKATDAIYRATHKKEIHEYYVANREEILPRNAAWKKDHPESSAKYYAGHTEQTRAHQAVYYQENKGAVLAQNAIWNNAHPDLMKAVKAKSRKAHPEGVAKGNAKRRVLGFIPLNQPFEGCNGHHVDRERVVYIPEVLHMSIRHNVWNGRNMDKINAAAFDYLSKQEVAQ